MNLRASAKVGADIDGEDVLRIAVGFFERLKALVEGLHRGLVQMVYGAVMVLPGAAVERAGEQLQAQHGIGIVAVLVADGQVLAVFEAVLAVVLRVAEDDDGFFAVLRGELRGVADEGAADALALVLGQHAERTEGENIHGLPLLIQQPGAGVQDTAHQLSVELGDEVVFGQEIGVGAQDVSQVVLLAAGEVQVPEGAAGELFDEAVVGRGFGAEGEGHGEVLGGRVRAILTYESSRFF